MKDTPSVMCAALWWSCTRLFFPKGGLFWVIGACAGIEHSCTGRNFQRGSRCNAYCAFVILTCTFHDELLRPGGLSHTLCVNSCACMLLLTYMLLIHISPALYLRPNFGNRNRRVESGGLYICTLVSPRPTFLAVFRCVIQLQLLYRGINVHEIGVFIMSDIRDQLALILEAALCVCACVLLCWHLCLCVWGRQAYGHLWLARVAVV